MDSFTRLFEAAHAGAYGMNTLPEPTRAQREADDYAKGEGTFQGIPVVIENPRGSMRKWWAADGTSGENLQTAHYGGFAGVTGADGDELDCYIGPYPESNAVFVINQFVRGGWDEHKVMLGFPDRRTAEATYLSNFKPGWDGLNSCVACTVDQLKWWMANGDLSKPLTPDQLPHEESKQMDKVLWDSANQPKGMNAAQVLYAIRAHDKDDALIFDPLSAADILEDSDGVVVLDALVLPYRKLEQQMTILQKLLSRAGGSLDVLAMQVTDPFKRNGTTNVAAIFELSDGQTLTIFFHNPDVTPGKIMPSDELVSWKWMLNKKDVTIVVAPERGRDLNVRNVAARVMLLANKNSARFVTTNAKRAAVMEAIETLKGEFETKTETLNGLMSEISDLEVQVAAKPPKAADPEPQSAAEPDVPLATQVADAMEPEAKTVAQTAIDNQDTATLDAIQAALDAQIDALSLEDLRRMATYEPTSIAGGEKLDEYDLRAKLKQMHPDDIQTSLDYLAKLHESIAAEEAERAAIAAAQAQLPLEPVSAAPADAAPDLTYRAVDDMFTAFYPETPAGEEAWKSIAEQTDGTGKVLHAQVEGTIVQLRAAGYTVAEAPAAVAASADDLLAALGEPDAAQVEPVATEPVAAAPIFDPTTPEGYAEVMADPDKQLQWQDRLDAFFQERIIAVRNALRELGWTGEQGGDLSKGNQPLSFAFDKVGAGANVVGYRVGFPGIRLISQRDDLSMTAEQFAAYIDGLLPAQAAAPSAEDAPLEARIARAAELGAQAFADGKPSTPALNADLTALLAGLPVGGGGAEILDAYTKAWHAANAAAPVADVADDPAQAAADPAPAEPVTPQYGADVVSVYSTRTGKEGMVIRRNTWRDGTTTYSYIGEYGATSGRSYDDMLAEVNAQKSRRKGMALTYGAEFADLQPADTARVADEAAARAAMAKLRPFLPTAQSRAVLDLMRGEERQFFFDKVVEMAGIIDAMPVSYQTDGQGYEAVARLHYFRGGSDWYITEKDRDGDGTEQAFGYTILNGDRDNAALGYISIAELVRNGVELDLHWSPLTLAQIRGNDQADDEPVAQPEAQPEPETLPQTATTAYDEDPWMLPQATIQAMADTDYAAIMARLADANMHTEALVLRAARIGTEADHGEAFAIWQEYMRDGMTPELAARRDRLEQFLNGELAAWAQAAQAAAEPTPTLPSEPAPESAQPAALVDMENYIKVAANSVAELRRVDVYRVLNSVAADNIDGVTRATLANWIINNRPDLADEVRTVMAEEWPGELDVPAVDPVVPVEQPLPEAGTELPPAAGEVPAENPDRDADLAYLNDVIEGRIDMWENDPADRIEALVGKYPNDADMQTAARNAINTYVDFMAKASVSA